MLCTQNVQQQPMRKLYTECDLRRASCEGLQSCTSRVIKTPNISMPPTITDTLAAAATPDYGSFAARQRHRAASSAADDDGDVEECSAPNTEIISFETASSAATPRWRWSQWRRWRPWLNSDAVTLAESIDKYSRVGFPFVFVVLSIVYWAVYLQIRPTEYDGEFVIVD